MKRVGMGLMDGKKYFELTRKVPIEAPKTDFFKQKIKILVLITTKILYTQKFFYSYFEII